MRTIREYTILVLFVLLANCLYAQKIDYSGQLIGWGTINPADPFTLQAGSRYIPELSYIETYQDNINFEAKFSYNAYVNQLFWDTDSTKSEYGYKPYRFWVKYSGKRIELRGGLQKINFGSAQLLRPLMWFDKIDPRDPLQLTDGVYGVLGRYYFLNNANIWLWTLISNDEPKGWEYFGSVKSKPEFGGRIQLPVLTGEIATTYHFRKANIEGTFADSLTNLSRFNENRFGLDFKIDYTIGFWAESAIIYQDFNFSKEKLTKMFTIGADYTFNLGSGLTFVAEYFNYGKSSKLFNSKNAVSFTAVSLNYPVTIISSVGGMLYYDYGNEEFYRFINWSWQYDKWSFYVMAFWNPEKFQIYQNATEAGLFAGKGVQLMAVFNH